jgi:hypothetical protein
VENFVEYRAIRFLCPLFSAIYAVCPLDAAHPSELRINEIQLVSDIPPDFAIETEETTKLGTFAQS